MPKAELRQSSCPSFLCFQDLRTQKLLGTFMKLTSAINFIFVLRTVFMCAEPKSVKKMVKLSSFLRFQNLCAQKLRVNMLVKSTPAVKTSMALSIYLIISVVLLCGKCVHKVRRVFTAMTSCVFSIHRCRTTRYRVPGNRTIGGQFQQCFTPSF